MKHFLRYGSHSEKRYYQKMSHFFDGVIFSSNLLEASPSATASLILNISGLKQPKTSYVLDPMTYSFGVLEWIMSSKKDGTKAVKRSYQKLADALGGGFESCVSEQKAIDIGFLKNPSVIDSICKSTIDYQNNRIKDILSEDEELAQLGDGIPRPSMTFAPYFFIQPDKQNEWLDTIGDIVDASANYEKNSLYIKLCFDKHLLLNEKFKQKVYRICEKQFKGVWLWVDDFDEKKMSVTDLKAFAEMVNNISEMGKEVFNRHGGFYSFALSHRGMTGVSSAVGYGEHKKIVPVVGSASPTVNYYYPKLYTKLGIPDIEESFDENGIQSSEMFFESVCDCIICKGVIKNELSNFINFGTVHFATPKSKRPTQTPSAAERSRYHYLFCKIREKKTIESSDLNQIIKSLNGSLSVANLDVFREKTQHIAKWIDALREFD